MSLFSLYVRFLAILAIAQMTNGLYLLWGLGVATFWGGVFTAIYAIGELVNREEQDYVNGK